MNENARYLTQVLEKIGQPLMLSILDNAEISGDEIAPEARLQQEAQNMAGLLGKTVLAGIEMGSSMDFGAVPDQGDSLRLALTAIAGPLVAHQYVKSSRLPTEQDIKRVATSLQAVLTFSENFSPSPQNAERLEHIAARGIAVDAHQVGLQYIEAFIPVINAVSDFPFGHPEQKIIGEIAGKLVEKSVQIRESLSMDLSEDEQKFTELSILKSLAALYSACHVAETARLMGLSDDERANHPQSSGGGLSLDSVWAAFDLKMAMLEALMRHIVPGTGQAVTAAGGGVAPIPVQSDAPAAAPVAPAAAAPAPAAASSPMSMFVKKPETAAETVSAAAPAQVPETGGTPPPVEASSAAPAAGAGPMSMFAKKPEAAPVSAPASEPVSDSAVAEKAPETQAEGGQVQGGGGPMSFFKTPPKEE